MNIPNNNPAALAHMPEIRKLILEGRIPEAFDLSEKYVAGIPGKIRSYQTLGDIYFQFADTVGKITDYRRELNLRTGIAKVSFKRDGNKIEYEVYSSAPDNVLVISMRSKKEGGLDMSISLQRQQDAVISVMDGRIDMEGQVIDSDDPALGPGGAHMRFFASLLPTAYDGKLTHDNNSLKYTGGTELVMFFNAATDYNVDSLNFDRTIDPRRKCTDAISTASWKSFELLRKNHIAEHSSMFDRVSLHLGKDNKADTIPTDERLRKFQAGGEDPGLIALYFQYGRYLLMGSSRHPAQLPANLQGIWNKDYWAPWGSDYHVNINLQMNYWPAEVCNLSETVDPLITFMDRAYGSGKCHCPRDVRCEGVDNASYNGCLRQDIRDRWRLLGHVPPWRSMDDAAIMGTL